VSKTTTSDNSERVDPNPGKAGFQSWRQKGSHLTMYRDTDNRALAVPIHFSKTIPKGTLSAIIKQAGLTVEEFLK